MRNLFVSLLMLLATAAPARGAEALHNRVVVMLSAYESLPPPSDWRRLGSACVPILNAIANDTSQPTFRRARALTVLGYFDAEEAAAILRTLADCGECNQSLRRHALIGLSSSRPNEVVQYAGRALDSSDRATRQVAVKILQKSSSPDARRLLQEHQASK